MKQGSLFALVAQNLRRAPLRILLLLVLMVAGLTGRTLYTYFFDQLLHQASVAGETRAVPVLAITPPGRSLVSAMDRSIARQMVTTDQLTGTLFSAYTAAGQQEILALDPTALMDSFPDSLTWEGVWPTHAGQIALPMDLAANVGIALGDDFAMSRHSLLQDWSFLEVVGLFSVSPQAPFPPATFDRPLMACAGHEEPNLALVTTMTQDSPRGWRWRRPTTPSQLAADFTWVYHDENPLPRAGFWAYPLRGFAIPGSWARDTTTLLAQEIYGGGQSVLALGYAFVGLGIYSVLIIALIQRRREVAIYKTVGLSPRQLLFVFGSEVLFISLAALAIGVACIAYLSRQVAMVMDLDGTVQFGVILQSLALGAALVTLAAAIPVGMAVTATVNQLLHRQKIYLFSRRITLGGAKEE